MGNSSRTSGFTLVELLVVIGIIGLLISILLPSLNKAREQANSIKCQANLRQIGGLLSIYASENHGYLPPASFTLTPTNGPGWLNPGPNGGGSDVNPQSCTHGEGGIAAFWPDFLTLMVTKRTVPQAVGSSNLNYSQYTLANCGYMAADFSPIFHDTDLPAEAFMPRVSTYFCNMRVIPPLNIRDRATFTAGGASPLGANYVFDHLRSLGSFNRSAEIMAVWCGPAYLNGANLDILQYDSASWDLDNNSYNVGNQYVMPQSTYAAALGYPTSGYGSLIGLCGSALSGSSMVPGSVTKSVLQASNVDVVNANQTYIPYMRFRHMNNTSGNFLFLDGHVEARPLGGVYAKDVCMNWH